MTEDELQKFNIIKKVVNKELTQKEAMVELKKSRQQIYRLIKKYNEEGEQGFIHKNRGRISEKKNRCNYY